MDLLGEEKKKNSKTREQKIILTLLIIAIILFVLLSFTLALVKSQMGVSNENEKIFVNENMYLSSELGIIEIEGSIDKYISVEKISELLSIEYNHGEYNIPGEDNDKGYIINNGIISQLYSNSNKIFKTKEVLIDTNSNTGSSEYYEETQKYEYYELKNNVIIYENNLYISINDLPLALNVIMHKNEINNTINIMSPTYWIDKNTETLKEQNIIISNNSENQRAMAYNYVVIQKNSKYGVIGLDGEEIIGLKYNDMIFSEYLEGYIVSNSYNKYGVINLDGTTKLDIQYDSIEVINYDPLLYKVGKLDSFGIVNEQGTILNEINYDSIGYPGDQVKGSSYTLLIPKLNENIPETIVVCKDNKYGLIEIESGKVLIPCELNGIFLVIDKEENFKKYYVVEMDDGNITTLEKYFNSVNQITANINS